MYVARHDDEKSVADETGDLRAEDDKEWICVEHDAVQNATETGLTVQDARKYHVSALVPLGTVVTYRVFCSPDFYLNIGMPRVPAPVYHAIQWKNPEAAQRFFRDMSAKVAPKLWNTMIKYRHRRRVYLHMDKYKNMIDRWPWLRSTSYDERRNVVWHFLNELCRLDADSTLDGKFCGMRFDVEHNAKMTIHVFW